MQILVVDDDPLACEMTATLLEFQGYTTVMANDAIQLPRECCDTTQESLMKQLPHPPSHPWTPPADILQWPGWRRNVAYACEGIQRNATKKRYGRVNN